MCLCVCVYLCVCLFICVCLSLCVCQSIKGRAEICHFYSKNLNVKEIDTISKTHKYKQCKKNSLYCESQSTVCTGEKVQNVKIF